MAKLPKHLIKKYGISKKAWSVFRGSRKKSRRPTMAKRRKTRRVYMKPKRRRSRSSAGGSPMKLILPAAIYGAGRQYLVNLASPITAAVPLGQYADEAVLGIAGYYLAKKGRGQLKQIGRAMLTIEAASLGSGLIGGKIGGGGNSGGAF